MLNEGFNVSVTLTFLIKSDHQAMRQNDVTCVYYSATTAYTTAFEASHTIILPIISLREPLDQLLQVKHGYKGNIVYMIQITLVDKLYATAVVS